ncbi:glycoside hydrolase [Hesseltinella vesiculosa]|uniref:Chitinase domain-containing protein 1 n=1 Tax=Hesseltinella vesiculosa TaxID=101127 RepID=A0A1X2GKG5_9FUNG|nr:glycoside hydrolase [Hesseltinella vesiculosa]
MDQASIVDHDTAHVKLFRGGDTLAYVTPWNNRGYDIVKEFKGKFDYVAPVWYNVHRSAGKFKFEGEHDVTTEWMAEVRGTDSDRGTVGKITPRFQLHGWSMQDYNDFINAPKEFEVLTKDILDQVTRYGFDGIVLESAHPAALSGFFQVLSPRLHELDKELIAVIPPLRQGQPNIMDASAFAHLAQYVDRFSLMTYDYSSHNVDGGPSSPIDWLVENIEQLTNAQNRHQLMIGLNFYGVQYDAPMPPRPLTMKQVVETWSMPRDSLDDDFTDGSNIPMHWDKEYQEAWFHDSDEDGLEQGIVWIPTQKSIKNRVHLAEDYQVGLALWEVGQGLDYFYNVL